MKKRGAGLAARLERDETAGPGVGKSRIARRVLLLLRIKRTNGVRAGRYTAEAIPFSISGVSDCLSSASAVDCSSSLWCNCIISN